MLRIKPDLLINPFTIISARRVLLFLIVSQLMIVTYAQDKTTGTSHISKASHLAKHLLPTDSLIPGNYSGEFKNLFIQGKNNVQQLFSKTELFKGGKLFTGNNLAANVEYSYMRDTSGTALGLLNTMEAVVAYNVSAGVSLMSMPFDVSFQGTNGLYTAGYTPFNKLAKFNFDHEKYLQEIQSKAAAILSPDKLVSVAANRLNAIRKSYEKNLQRELQELKNDFARKYNAVIALPSDITDLSKTDMTALRNKLLQNSGSEYYNSVERMQEKVKSGNLASLATDSTYKMDQANMKRLEALEKVYSKVIAWKEKFENNKTVKELRNNLPFTPGNFKSFMNKPGNLGQVIDDHFDMNFVQRLFMNMTKFDVGQNPLNGGDFSLQNVINTGINTEFVNKKATVGFLYGKNNAVNNWLQSGLTSTISNEYSSVTGIKLGTGSSSLLKQFVSINLFDFNSALQTGTGNLLQPDYLANPSRRDATISFHSGLSFSPKHTLTVDVSRSFGSYVNNLSADSTGYKVNAHNDLLNSKEGKSNYAAMVDYNGELFNSDVRVFIKTVGLGYNNPGNILLRAGETQVGAGVTRRLAKQKLSVRYSIDYRKQNFDPAKRFSHTAINNKLQLGYRFKRNTRAGISYQRSDFVSRIFSGSVSKGVNERLQADGTYYFKVAGKRIMNTITISHQRMEVPVLIDQNYKSRSLMVLYSSTAIINKNPVSVLLLLNRSNNKDYLFNTSMFTSEVNYSYTVGEKIRLGNSLGYYDNTGWNRQVGIKQQVSAVLSGKLSVDIDVSYKKAVQVIRPELANQLFISSGMHFDF